MGFFKEFKEDLTQAVNELMPEDELSENQIEEDDFDDSDIVDTLKRADDDPPAAEETVIQEDPVPDMVETADDEETQEPQNMDDDIDQMPEDENMDEKDLKTEEIAAEPVIEKPEAAEIPDKAMPADDNVTIIMKGTKINGSIISDGSLEVKGTVTGDIECLGKLSIEGSVAGNSTAAEIFVNAPKMKGSLLSEGTVKVGQGTVVLGDVKGNSSVIAGAVKGDIDVNGPVIIDSTAIVKGNITAKSIQINNGAVVDGYCSLSYSDVAIDDFFEDEME